MIEFDWDEYKNRENQRKHKVSFDEAQYAFQDPHHVIAEDLDHSYTEDRYYCIGMINRGIITVSFTYRQHTIRIISAGYWQKGKQIYEEYNR